MTTSHTPPATPPVDTPPVATAATPIQNARALLKELQEKFVAFRDCMPLAIGIDKQLLAKIPQLDRKVLRLALGIHTKSLRYLKIMEKATHRFDLEGQTTDEVTDMHRAHAAELMRERFKKDAEKRKALREAEQAARQHAAKLGQLLAKFSRDGD